MRLGVSFDSGLNKLRDSQLLSVPLKAEENLSEIFLGSGLNPQHFSVNEFILLHFPCWNILNLHCRWFVTAGHLRAAVAPLKSSDEK